MGEQGVQRKYEEIKRLMNTLKPEAVVKLKPGETKRLGDLLIEMKDDGITIYVENGSQN